MLPSDRPRQLNPTPAHTSSVHTVTWTRFGRSVHARRGDDHPNRADRQHPPGYSREPFIADLLGEHVARPDQRIFVGVVSVIEPRVETPEEIRDRVLEAAADIPVAQLGITDDRGFSPFADDASTPREIAFAKIRARVEGTALAIRALGSAE